MVGSATRDLSRRAIGRSIEAMTLLSCRTETGRDRTRGGVLLLVLVVLGVVVLLAVAYLVVVLSWSYSTGERAGVLQKLSRKGWVCKTWEGELAMSTVPGVAPEIWSFSVRDDTVADQLRAVVGRRIVLTYSEHPGVPTSCFGETPYFAEGLRLEDSPPTTAPQTSR